MKWQNFKKSKKVCAFVLMAENPLFYWGFGSTNFCAKFVLFVLNNIFNINVCVLKLFVYLQ
jgi:hypothetical protein